MKTQAQPEVIDLQPHPRLLSVLGDIEFAPWQCLAELIDNAFDEFLRHPNLEEPTVTVTLPGRNSDPRTAEVWVKDNGPGLSLGDLQNALRAGWTSNDRFGQLGLFGMGFNIATARLGSTAVVRTARADASHWTVVTIDLPAMQAQGHFNVPVRTEPKENPEDRGTEILIKDLKPEHHDALVRRQPAIRNVLGDVYSYLLTQRDFRLVVDRQAVKPRRPCTWSPERSVVRKGDQIPAVINIDIPLTDRLACLHCGQWQDDLGEQACVRCNSHRLDRRERRIWGWVGVQRYLHQSDFGIDFLRNGRKILLRDKSLFSWVDPDEPSGGGLREYPVEIPNGQGRLIGEIHVDHVAVNYQKNAFEYGSPDWTKVKRVLRGEGPLLPEKARQLGFATANTSPLARLITGYRRNDAGVKYLTPGDDRGPIHERAREWAELFRKGENEYETDERWYRAAYEHDNPTPRAEEPPAEGDPDEIRRQAGLDDDPAPGEGQPEPPSEPVRETEDERRARWRTDARPVSDLETPFGLPGRGAAVKVDAAWRVTGHRDQIGPAGEPPRPVYIGTVRGAAVEIFIDAEHPIFTEFAVEIRDLVVFELADFMRTRDGGTDDLGDLFARLKQRCLPDQKVTGPHLKENADRLVSRIRETMQPVIAGNSSGYWQRLSETERAATQQKFAIEGGRGDWEDVISSGDWLDYAPALCLVRVVNTRPDAFLDAQVFRTSYVSLTDETARRAGLERVTDLLSDVAALSDQPIRRSPEELQRGRLSIWLLEAELADDAA